MYFGILWATLYTLYRFQKKEEFLALAEKSEKKENPVEKLSE
jgi:hypothetical protein